jgi:Ca2+-transporting ATPase
VFVSTNIKKAENMETKNPNKIVYESGSIQQLSTDAVYAALDSRPNGLTPQEIADRKESFGKNQITEKKGKHPFFIFLANMTSYMAILLWFGGIIAIIAQMPELGIAIFAVNIINGAFSFWQEYRAGKATEALKRMLPSFSRVIRDGQEQQILAEDLVPGDIVLIAEGDKISADARLLMSSDLQCNQSTLTGESTTVRKSHEPVLREGLSRPEMGNLIFTGTSVSSGTGKALVFSTGMDTEFGKIAKLTQSMVEEQSPLQKELDLLTKQVSLMALLIGVGFFFTAVFFVKEPIAKSFIFSLGMIVAFIPEGLLPTVTLALAMAVQRMVKEHALVKRLSAVETLGCTTVICSDKTGTLTQNEMTVGNLWMPGREYEVTGLGYAPTGEILHLGKKVDVATDTDLKLLISAAALCSLRRSDGSLSWRSRAKSRDRYGRAKQSHAQIARIAFRFAPQTHGDRPPDAAEQRKHQTDRLYQRRSERGHGVMRNDLGRRQSHPDHGAAPDRYHGSQ